MKKIIVAICLMLLAAYACAETGAFEFDSSNYAVTGYTGGGGEVVIPNEIDGCPVESIFYGTFSNNSEITSLILPDTLLDLGQGNISGMENLEQVVLPESLVAIDYSNFSWCNKLERVDIPAKVSFIGKNCFVACDNLSEIRFAGDVPAIGAGCFDYLPEDCVVYVPEDRLDAYRAALPEWMDVRSTGEDAVVYDYTAQEWEFTFDPALGEITAYNGFSARVDIPETIEGVQVRAIGASAFEGHRYIYYVTVPEGVETIGENAFANTWHLGYAHLPSTLKEIAAGAFADFRGTGIEIPEGVKSIGEAAFGGAWLEEALYLPEGLVSVGDKAFYQTSIPEIYFPSTIETIGSEAFAGYNCLYLYFEGKDLPAIGENAFAEQPIADVDINWQASKQQMISAQEFFDAAGHSTRVWRMQNPNVDYIQDYLDTYEEGVMTGYTGEQTHIRPWDTFDDYTVTAVGEGAFRGNDVIEYFAVPYSDAFTTIGAEAFADSSLAYIDLYDSVTTIGEGAFRNCVNLKEITIPESVVEIGEGAFEGCAGLEKITFLCDTSALTEGMLDSCENLAEYNGRPGMTEEERRALRVALFGKPELIITKQPGDASAFEGETAETSVEAIGEELTYEWYVRGMMDEEYIPDENCTGNVFTMIMDEESDQSQVYCRITDIYGSAVESDWVLFVMEQPELPEIELPALDESAAPYIGLWEMVSAEAGGETFDKETLDMIGMSMQLILNDDGSAQAVTTGEEPGDGGRWAVVDGMVCLAADGEMIALAPEADGALIWNTGEEAYRFERADSAGMAVESAESPVYADTVLEFEGTWHACYIATGGMNCDPRDMSLAITLVLNPDGTGSIDFPDLQAGNWYQDPEYGQVFFRQDESGMDMPMTILDGEFLQYGSKMGGYIIFSRSVEAIWNPEEAAEASAAEALPEPQAQADAQPVSAEERLERKFVNVNDEAGGYVLAASVVFHADGSADFEVAGMAMPDVKWTHVKMQTDSGEKDVFAATYYGTALNFIWNETGFDLNYFDSAQMRFVPAA